MIRWAFLGGAVLVALAYAGINFGFRWIPEEAKAIVSQKDLLEYPEAERCGERHRTIYESWKKSRHAQAWISETYIKDSDNRAKEKCLPCHIPVEVKDGGKPEFRQIKRDEGVYCVPCHVTDKKMQGPYDLYAPPHPTAVNPVYRKSQFCGSCHQKTIKEWQASGSEKNCQSCHMRGTNDWLTQKWPLNLLHSRKYMADHSFPHGEIGEDDVRVKTSMTEKNISVILLNQTIPHHVPTADNGDPRLYLYARLLNGEDVEIDEFKEILAPQQETALPYGSEVRFTFPRTAQARKAEVSLFYKPAWSKEKSILFRKEYELPS